MNLLREGCHKEKHEPPREIETKVGGCRKCHPSHVPEIGHQPTTANVTVRYACLYYRFTHIP